MPEELDGDRRQASWTFAAAGRQSLHRRYRRAGRALLVSPAWRRIERLKKRRHYPPAKSRFWIMKSSASPSRSSAQRQAAAAFAGKPGSSFESGQWSQWPEVVDCATVTGTVDYMLRIVTRDMHAYDDFLRDKMLALGPGQQTCNRAFVMRVAEAHAPRRRCRWFPSTHSSTPNSVRRRGVLGLRDHLLPRAGQRNAGGSTAA